MRLGFEWQVGSQCASQPQLARGADRPEVAASGHQRPHEGIRDIEP